MKRLAALLFPALILVGGCSPENDPVVPENPDLYTATGDFHNFLVGDGSIDTRASFRQGNDIKLGDHIVPNGASTNRGLLLDSPAQASSLKFFLTEGDSTVLNQGEIFNLNNRGDYVFLAIGDVQDPSGQTRPTLLQMDALSDPPLNQVRFRFSHALTGWTGAVDVHVNGEILTNVRYGHESEAILFDARAADQDTLIVVPTGQDPDGVHVLWNARGVDLFDEGDAVDAFFAHEPHDSYFGDIVGEYQVLIGSRVIQPQSAAPPVR